MIVAVVVMVVPVVVWAVPITSWVLVMAASKGQHARGQSGCYNCTSHRASHVRYPRRLPNRIQNRGYLPRFLCQSERGHALEPAGGSTRPTGCQPLAALGIVPGDACRSCWR